MPVLCDSKYCTGCSACMNACRVGAITMQSNSEGFLHPIIDEKLCISCGICEKSCPINVTGAVNNQTTCYAVINRDSAVRSESTSGGVFTLFAEYVINKGGVVFGAVYNKDFSVSHDYTNDINDLYRFRIAKYVQSNIGFAYKKAEQYLKDGILVLFSGTPCQIAGLQSYLRKPYENLICVDLVCHGIPSPEIWKHYITYRAKNDNEGVYPISINLRSKITGWQRYSVHFQYQEKEYSSIFSDDPYMQGYIRDLYTRESCFECRFKGINRSSDFTLGDYWGIEGSHPEMNDGMGTSLVFVHSEKAIEILQDILEKTKYLKVESESAVQWNQMALKSTPYQEKRDEFFKRYMSEDFAELINELTQKNATSDIGIIKRILSRLHGKIRHD